MCDSAGVMYWGDAGHKQIETAYLNGTERRTLLRERGTTYIAFAVHDGTVYFTDWSSAYACLFSPANDAFTFSFPVFPLRALVALMSPSLHWQLAIWFIALFLVQMHLVLFTVLIFKLQMMFLAREACT